MVSSGSSTQGGLSALFQFIAVSVITGVVAAGLAIPAVGAASASAEGAVDIFEALPAELEERPLAQQSEMLAADGSVIARFFWQNREEVEIDSISEEMQSATLAVEDHRFFDHGGVDIEGIARAAVSNLISDSTQGGSTLTQQYVKNVLVENSHADEDLEGISEARESEGTAGYARKLREAKLAVAVEKKYDKTEILNRYLNIANYSGSPNNFGVQAAAYHYWGIDASELNVQQSATLAGIVQNPARFNPESNPEDTLQRRNVVLGQMLKYEFIDQEQYDEAVDTDLDLDVHRTPNGCSAAEGKAYFCDYVQAVIENSDLYGEDADERTRFLQRGGLTIQTTLDPEIQDIAVKEVNNRIPADDASGAGHTIVTVEPGTGKVIAMAQNREYTVEASEEDSDRSKTSINYNVDRAHHGAVGFQVGSTWKPFVLAEWLKSGKTLSSTVNATKRTFPANSWTYSGCDNNASSYEPNNAGDGRGSSSMTALQATKGSVNTAYTAMANQLNMCDIMETAMDLGVKKGNGEPLDAPVEEGNNAGLTYALLPSSVLGTAEVAPLDMAAAYATFASGGTYCKPSPIESITDPSGEEIDVPDPDCHEALDEDVAQGVAYALTQTFNGGTTSGLGIGVPAGAKTGTTNFPVGSTWLLGFTKTLSTAVWTGSADGNRDWRQNRSGVVRGNVFGATFSGRTWSAYMSQAVQHTEGNTGFSRPPSSIVGSSPNRTPSNNNNGGGNDNNGGGGGGSQNDDGGNDNGGGLGGG